MPASGFSLPELGNETWVGALKKLQKPVEDGRITTRNFQRLSAAVEMSAQEDEETTGLIHGDMVPGNVLQSDSATYVIDFDNSGLGPYSHDIAWVLTQLDSDLRREFLETYSRTRCHRSPEVREIERHFVLSQIYHSSRWVNDVNHDFPGIPQISSACSKLIDGIPFLFE